MIRADATRARRRRRRRHRLATSNSSGMARTTASATRPPTASAWRTLATPPTEWEESSTMTRGSGAGCTGPTLSGVSSGSTGSSLRSGALPILVTSVGSIATQPAPVRYTSGQAWASASVMV
jgi:hypothetical protein